jgi:hypothetical protein
MRRQSVLVLAIVTAVHLSASDSNADMGSDYNAIILHPSGFEWSMAFGVSGGQQVGYGFGTPTDSAQPAHALMWSGTADSYIDLNPAGFNYSEAWGISDGQQVGWGIMEGYSAPHALLWSGTAYSYVDLTPNGFSARAIGISDGQQVGWGSQSSNPSHALMWSGAVKVCVKAGIGRKVGYEKRVFMHIFSKNCQKFLDRLR